MYTVFLQTYLITEPFIQEPFLMPTIERILETI